MKKFSGKKLLCMLLSCMMLFTLAGCGGSSSTENTDAAGSADTTEADDSGSSDDASKDASQESVKAIIGTQDLLGGAAVTKGENYFQQTMGDGAEIKVFSAGRDINSALASGSVDFGMFGVCPTVVGLTSGTDFKIIYIECLIRGSEGMVVRKGSGIESVEDLKGKKVAVTVASSGHYGLLCALEDAGMTVDDIEIVDMDPASTYSAWERGDIDAAYTWNPTLLNIAKEDGEILLTVEDLVAKGHQTINFHVVRTEFAKEHPEAVKAYCKALAMGVDLYKNDEAKALDVISNYLEIDAENAKEQMSDKYLTLEEQMSDEAFGNDTAANTILQVSEFLKEAGQIEDAKDLAFFQNAIDTSYIEELISEQ